MVKSYSGAEKAGEAGETDGCRGECASNRDGGRTMLCACGEYLLFCLFYGVTSITAEIIRGRAVSDILRQPTIEPP